MWPFYLYYFIVILLFAFILVINGIKRNSDIFLGFYLLIAVGVFWGLRSEHVGNDTINIYKPWFTSDNTYSTQLKTANKEAGFVLFSMAVKTFSNTNYRVYMLVVSFLVASLWYFAFKKNGPLPLAGFAYLVTQHFFITSCTNIIRQGIAMAIGALAVSFYCNGKKSYFYFLLIIAVFFHYSAILLILFPLFSKIRISKFWLIVTLFIILNISLLSSAGFVSEMYTRIVKVLPLPAVIKFRALKHLKDIDSGVLSYAFYLSTLVTIVLIALKKKIEIRNELQSQVLINGMLFYLLISILLSFNEILSRLTMYFYIAEFLAIPIILNTFLESTPKYKTLIIHLFIYFLLISSLKTIYSLSGTPFMVPYIE